MNEQIHNFQPEDRRMPALVDDGRYPARNGQFLSIDGDQDRDTLAGGRNVQYYLAILFKYRHMIITSVAAAFFIGLFTSLLATRYYTATATIQIDQQNLEVVDGKNVLPAGVEANFFNTQLEVLRSRKLAERVVNRLGLDQESSVTGGSIFSVSRLIGLFRAKQSVDAAAKSSLKRAAVDKVLSGSSFKLIGRTRIVRIAYTDRRPSQAQRVANSLAESYLKLNLDRKVEASSYARNFLEDQIAILKTKLEESETALVDYAQKEQIVETGDKVSLVGRQLTSGNEALGKAVSERITAEYAWKQASNTPVLALSQVMENKFIEKLRTEHAELRSKYQDMLGSFKPRYPNMIRLRARIAEIRKSINQETENVKKSLKATYEAAKYQEDLATLVVEQQKAELLKLSKRMIRYNILKREADTNRKLYAGLLNRYKEVGVAASVGANNVSIVDRALRPNAPSSPKVKRNLFIALMLGLMAGVGLAVLRESLDDTLKSPEEVDSISGVATLGIVPTTGPGEEMEALLQDVRSSQSEAYRSMATSLQFSTGNGVPKTLLITSSRAGEGKTTTSRALARHFARLGLQVLLVDCDLRNPSLHVLFGIDNSIGLSTYLSGNCRAPDTIQATDDPNLMIVGTGPLPPNPAELLSHARMVSLLSIASEKFDLVILDGPPIMGLADAPIISSIVEGTAIVIAASETKSENFRRCLQRVRFTRGKVIGTVLTKFEPEMGGYGYGYGYGYNDQYSYGEIAEPAKLNSAS